MGQSERVVCRRKVNRPASLIASYLLCIVTEIPAIGFFSSFILFFSSSSFTVVVFSLLPFFLNLLFSYYFPHFFHFLPPFAVYLVLLLLPFALFPLSLFPWCVACMHELCLLATDVIRLIGETYFGRSFPFFFFFKANQERKITTHYGYDIYLFLSDMEI